MIGSKEAYLKKLTAGMKMKSVSVGKELAGSSPPSVFIGSWNYPKVYAGPMIAPVHGDTMVMDAPEMWLPRDKTQEEIIDYRLNLVRGKRAIKITDLDNPLVSKLRDISLAAESIESEAEFLKTPRGFSLSDEHTPYGPSAELRNFDISNVRWDRSLEKVYYDTDLKAADAVVGLHSKNVPFSSIQKAFSVGTMGTKNRRKMVPTRWSITACDSAIGNHLLKQVRHHDVIDSFRVYEYSSLNNYYAIMLLPSFWQYEWMEAFLHIQGNEELLFSDYEHNTGKKGYSRVGGCYYSCKMAVLEALARKKEQAGAIIFREAYKGYVPLGVFNVRENVRSAMQQTPTRFPDMKAALEYIESKTYLSASRFVKDSDLLKELQTSRQTTLNSF